jgi:ATP/maltotriose-dependent transcriptional regulator MalT
MQMTMEASRMNILSAYSATKASSASGAAFNHQETACAACQRFTLISILHVIYQMEVNPHFARLMGELASYSLQKSHNAAPAGYNARVASMKPHELVDPLTNRELEVLHLMSKQLSYKDIAEMLFISPLTVKTHVHHIYRKLGVNRRRFAIQRARELGLVQPG